MKWLVDFVILFIVEFNLEMKVIKEFFVMVVKIDDDLDYFLFKYNYWKVL